MNGTNGVDAGQERESNVDGHNARTNLEAPMLLAEHE